MCERAEVSHVCVYGWIAKGSQIYAKLKRFSMVLGCTMEDLFDLDPDELGGYLYYLDKDKESVDKKIREVFDDYIRDEEPSNDDLMQNYSKEELAEQLKFAYAQLDTIYDILFKGGRYGKNKR